MESWSSLRCSSCCIAPGPAPPGIAHQVSPAGAVQSFYYIEPGAGWGHTGLGLPMRPGHGQAPCVSHPPRARGSLRLEGLDSLVQRGEGTRGPAAAPARERRRTGDGSGVINAAHNWG